MFSSLAAIRLHSFWLFVESIKYTDWYYLQGIFHSYINAA